MMSISGTGRDAVRKELARMAKEGMAKRAGERPTKQGKLLLWEVVSTMEAKTRMCAEALSQCFGGFAYTC